MLRTLEKYEIIEEIGHGGMATVFRARDTKLDRLVASLARLGDGVAGDDLKEMARDVLAGHTDLRQVAATDAYGGMLLDRYQRFREWEQNVAPEECQHMADQAADLTADLNMRDQQ